MVAPDVEPYWLRLRRLRAEKSLTEDDLVRRAPEGLSRSTIQALQRPYEPQRQGRASRSRYPSAETFERISAALGVEPATFPEYRLARARELLDERSHGLEQALRSLEAFDAAQQQLTEEETATEAERTAPTAQTDEATGPASGTAGGEAPAS